MNLRLTPFSQVLIATLAVACGSETQEANHRSRALTPSISWADLRAEAGVSTAERSNGRFELGSVHEAYVGEARSPALSPDGQQILFTGPEHRGLFLVSVSGSASAPLTNDRRAGYRPVWSPQSDRVAYRAPGQSATAVPLRAAFIDGTESPAFLESPEVVVIEEQNRIVLVEEGQRREVSPELGAERFIAPLTSPGGSFVAFEGLSTGLYLFDRAGERTVFLGPGTHARFSHDERRLVFARQLDDGHQLTQSDLVVVDLTSANFETTQLTDTPDVLEVEPSLNGDGSLVAFRVGTSIRIASITPANRQR